MNMINSMLKFNLKKLSLSTYSPLFFSINLSIFIILAINHLLTALATGISCVLLKQAPLFNSTI
ncbi:MAG: hypothetical protein LBC53_01400 [Spirochaetaceae bacterium]|nr:hypothetical protein [Spirochaetaceae bacterium]